MRPRQQPGSRGRAAPVRADDCQALRLAPELSADMPASRASARVIHTGTHLDRSGTWLRNASAGLGVLAGAAAVVSFTAQYRMVFAARRLAVVAGLEAAIPDAGALVFASLGIALALHGRRAVRARVLNVAAVAVSVVMNAIAAVPGWRGLAIWVMPPVAYALASDTLIGVVRARAIARQKALNARLADEQVTPLAMLGGLLLWLLRLVLAPGVHPGRIPRLGARGMPDRARPPRSRADGRSRRSPRPGASRPVPGEARGTARRPPGSWPSWPSGTGRWPPSRSRTWPGSRPSSRRGRAERRARRGPRCAAPCWPHRTGARHEARHRPGGHPHPGPGRQVGVRAGPGAAGEPGPARPDPAAAAAAPGPRVRHRGGAVAAVGTAGGVPQVRPGPPLAAGVAADAASGRALDLARPGAVPAPAAGAAGRARAADGPAPDREDRAARRHHPALSRPGHLHHHQARRVRASPPASAPPAARCTCSTPSRSAASPRRSGGPRSTGARTRRWRSAARTRSPTRCPRRAWRTRTFWSAKASDYLRAYFHAAALAGADMAPVARWVARRRPGGPRGNPAPPPARTSGR